MIVGLSSFGKKLSKGSFLMRKPGSGKPREFFSTKKNVKHILFFSIVLGAEYLSYVKSIETDTHAFLPLNISAVGSVFHETHNKVKCRFRNKISF